MKSYGSALAALNKAERRLDEERKWMQSCGGNLSGYLANYGSVHSPNHYGDGAEAIYAADIAKVATLEAEVARLREEVARLR